MRLRNFILIIAGVVERLALVQCRSHRQLFIDLAKPLISAQDHGLPPVGARLLDPYRLAISNYIRGLAKTREALSGSSGRFLRLPLGFRFGKLYFSPLLQLAKLVMIDSVANVDFESLPRTSNKIRLNIRRRIGLNQRDGEPAAFKTILGFSLEDYCAFLSTLRRSDPVLFVMLMANEFSYARDWASAHTRDNLPWVERAAALGELERLVEIVSFAKDHPLSIVQLLRDHILIGVKKQRFCLALRL
jgi:hypothetical protein